MKNLDDIAKEHGIDNIDLGNAVSAVIASRKCSYLEAEWDVAHQIADVYEKGRK